MKTFNEIPFHTQTSRIIHINGDNVEVFASEGQDLDDICRRARKFMKISDVVSIPIDSSPTNSYRYYINADTTTSATSWYNGLTGTASSSTWYITS